MDYSRITMVKADQLISFLKYKAQMNIAEKRRPQLGSFNQEIIGEKYWLRLSSVGNYLGYETLVIRILKKLDDLHVSWLDPSQFLLIEEFSKISKLVLFAGPTGSGKTSSIHSLLNSFDAKKLILGIEDPVEIENPNIIQLQVNEQADMGYPELLKVALRHHPDILYVGEVRDGKTAKAVINAGFSGHLVISTIHAASANLVVNRLVDLGIDKNSVQEILGLVIYQRLVKTKSGLKAIANIQYRGKDVSNWKAILTEGFNLGKIEEEEYEKFQKMEN
jgi:competence protein ComGA